MKIPVHIRAKHSIIIFCGWNAVSSELGRTHLAIYLHHRGAPCEESEKSSTSSTSAPHDDIPDRSGYALEMSFRYVQTISLWLPCSWFLACGANAGDQTGDSSAAADPTVDGSTEPTEGPECLVPENEDVANAGDELSCVMAEALDGLLALDVTEWPELSPESDCPLLNEAVEVDVAVPCTVASVSIDANSTAVDLECTDGDQKNHRLTLNIGSPTLRFPVCESAVLKLN